MSEPKTFGELTGFTPIWDVVIAEFSQNKIKGRTVKKGEDRKRYSISPLVVAVIYGRVWRRCQGDEGICWESAGSMAEALGLSRSTVRACLLALVETGWLNRGGRHPKYHSRIYSIPRVMQSSPPDVVQSSPPINGEGGSEFTTKIELKKQDDDRGSSPSVSFVNRLRETSKKTQEFSYEKTATILEESGITEERYDIFLIDETNGWPAIKPSQAGKPWTSQIVEHLTEGWQTGLEANYQEKTYTIRDTEMTVDGELIEVEREITELVRKSGK